MQNYSSLSSCFTSNTPTEELDNAHANGYDEDDDAAETEKSEQETKGKTPVVTPLATPVSTPGSTPRGGSEIIPEQDIPWLLYPLRTVK